MCDRISGAALCLFVVILAFSSLASATFTLSSLFESSVTADFAISRASNDGETFAFSTQPGAAWNADAAIIGNGRPVSLPVKRLSAGWYGSHYLQWLSFNPPAGSSGTIRITFATPVYKGVIAGNVEIKNAMLLVPLPQGVKKKPGKTAAFNRLIPLPFSVGLRIEVSSDDIHELTYGMLAEAKVPVASIAAKSYRLFVGSREVPVLITANPNQPLKTGDRILFYGESLRGTTSRYTAYSFSNIYWLTWSDSVAGQRVAMVSGERRIDDTHFSTDTALVHAREFYDTLHIEEDNDIRWLGDVDAPAEMTSTVSNNDDVDSWYWGFVGSSELTTFPVTIHPAAKTGIARLRIGFMGLTSVESDHADHQVSVLINGNPAGSNNLAVWDGQNPHVFTSDTFPVSRILKDRNEISFLVRKRDGEDMSALNWVEIEYPRIYRAEKDVLVFKSSSNSAGRNTHFELNGFTKREIDLWDIRKNRFFTGFEIRAGSGNDRQLFTLMFQDSIPLTTTYRAQLSSSYVSPSKPWLDTIRTDWKNLAGVDYVAISTGELGAALRPLLDMHEKRGLRTAFISLKDIYNSFSGGVTDPESIRSFVCMLFDLSPDHPPKYLLLAGDCTHDLYKKNRDRTIVPTHLSRVPGWGIASNDDYFGTVQDNDPFADLCVGRLPANNAGQLEIMVDKTVNYITKPERSFWRDNLLLASGAESEFTAFTNELSDDVIGRRMNILRMDADSRSPYYKDEFTSSSTMAALINSGVYSIAFNGHGGGNIWSDSKFFGFNDIWKLHNGSWGASGKLPIVFSFTCLTGFFESMYYRSLGEELLRTNANGAVCFIGASALTNQRGNMLLNRLILDHGLSGGPTTIGELLRYTKMNMLVRYGSPYLPLARQYILFGDPALPWELPPDTLRCTLEKTSLVPGDSLTVTASCAPVNTGTLSLLVGAGATTWNRSISTVGNGTVRRSFPVKDSVKTAAGIIRAYAWNDSAAVRGWATFSKDTIAVRNVTFSPAEGTFSFGDSIRVSCALSLPPASYGTVVFCLYAISAPHATIVTYQGVRMEPDSTTGLWRSAAAIPLTYAGDINRMLVVKFRVISGGIEKNSEPASYNIGGRPNLSFVNKSLSIVWEKDSLRCHTRVINTGNAAAPPFAVSFYWGDRTSRDTIITLRRIDSLSLGREWSGSFAFPDTAGTLRFAGVIEAPFQEIVPDDNTAEGTFRVSIRNCSTPADTVFSVGRGCMVTPAAALSAPRRVFLFDAPVTDSLPLVTESRWLPLIGDSIAAMNIGCRPALLGSDSLVWIFLPDSLRAKLAKTASASGRIAVMHRDPVIDRWRFCGAGNQTGSSGNGPYALAELQDMRPPSIQATVYGREITSLDYAAKDKPFNIMLSDASGIAPSSVVLKLNRELLAKQLTSAVPEKGDLRTITVTAYPPASITVDSLKVTAADLAGNVGEQTFAYLPGQNLDIKFLSCHPNPFYLREGSVNGPLQKVRFAFLLTDNAREVTLGIYTVSGRKIWSWRGENLIGYQEVAWNARDHDGCRIANGTYYLKMIASGNQKSAKKTIRIAKLEGY